MKILRVRFFNLNSLRGEHEVDFGSSPLADAGLFAITGPTGAGKTTILDAITLALYGQVPRHDASGPEQVMSHGTGESWAEVEFQAGGRIYRAKWGQHRARRRADGPLQESKMELSEQLLVEGEATWAFLETYKSRVPGRVAELSGLEYRQFLRSVLLAQGEFTKFLKSTAGERAQLLEKLTDTRRYSEISKAAYERAKLETQRVEDLQAGLRGVTLLSPDDVTGLETNVQQLTQRAQDATAEQQRLTEAQAWHGRLQDLIAQQQRGEFRRQTLASEAETLAPARRRIASHEQALPFRTPWVLLQKADDTLRLIRHEADQLRQQLPPLTTATAAARTARTAAAEARDQAAATQREQEPRLRAAEKLDLEITHATDRLKEQVREYDLNNKNFKQLKDAIGTADVRLAQLDQQNQQVLQWLAQHQYLAEADQALPDLAGLIQDWEHLRTDLGRLLKAETSQQQRLTAAEAAIAQGRAEAEAASRDLAAGRGQQRELHAERDTWLTRLQHQEVELREQHADQERAHDDLGRLVRAHALILTHEEARQRLPAGAPCPLCGATEHPYTADALGINNESVAADREREEELRHRLSALNARRNRVVALTGFLENIGGQVRSDAPFPAPLSEVEEAAASAGVRALGPQLRELEQQQQAQELALVKAEGRIQRAREQQAELNAELSKTRLELADTRERQPLVGQQLASLSTSFRLTMAGEYGPGLVAELRSLDDQFRQQREAQRTVAGELEKIHISREKDQLQQTEVQTWLSTRKIDLIAQNAALKLQGEERQLYSAGPDVAAALRELETTLQRADEQLTLATERLRKSENELGSAESLLHQRETDLTRQTEDRTIQHAALVTRLTNAGLAPDPAALAALLLPDAEVQHLAGQLQQHDQQLAVIRQTLTELTDQLHHEHARALTPDPAEAVAAQQQAGSEHLAAINQQLGQSRERLRDHQQRQERHAALAAGLHNQQQAAHRWRALAEIIGSADGKKFSEFAQGLTLARLVDLANRHLVRLTDRYRILRNPAEHLDLLIVDEYQASSRRSMNSLSGGESFLVSLALALGLSELAGRKTQIDTLFIDEGFGTLDPDALDVALTALETLQGTGKTIGIISHVEALKERVSTQINVRKGAGGVSSILVVGL